VGCDNPSLGSRPAADPPEHARTTTRQSAGFDHANAAAAAGPALGPVSGVATPWPATVPVVSRLVEQGTRSVGRAALPACPIR